MRRGRSLWSTVLAIVLVFALAPPGLARTVAGRIAAIDLERRTLTVEPEGADRVTLLVDESSVIELDGDEGASLDDLFEGDEVTAAELRELSSGRLLLVRATVVSRPAPAPEDDGAGDPDDAGHAGS